MQSGGFTAVDIDGWYQTTGTYVPLPSAFPGGLGTASGPTNSFAYVCAQIEAAGINVGLHCMTGMIATNDAYVKAGDTGLGQDSSFVLNTTLTSTGTTIVVQGNASSLPTSFGVWSGNVLQIGNELITYTATPTYNSGTNRTTFTGVTRGAYGTTKASHTSGANVGHLAVGYSAFLPSPDAPLLDNIAANLYNKVNACGATMILMDGDEAGLNTYAHNKLEHDIVAGFNHAVRVESSSDDSYSWTFQSVTNWTDYAVYGEKLFTDFRAASLAYWDQNALLPKDLGWFAVIASGNNGQGTLANYSLTAEDFEYYVVKAVANGDCLMLENCWPTSPPNGQQSQFLSILKNWETIAPSLSAATKAELAVPGNEFHLVTLPNGTLQIEQVNYTPQTADSATAGTSTWTVNNSYGTQYPTMTIQALSGVGSYTGTSTTLTGNQSDVSATTVSAASGITGTAVSWAGSPNGSLPYTGYPNGNNYLTFTATNASASITDSWAQASRVYSSALNIGTNGAVGVWIYGDGKGEILDLELFNGSASSPSAVDDHCLTVNFTGWKYFELPLAERSTQQYDAWTWQNCTYGWPINPNNSIYRNVLDPTHIAGINILYNNIPMGQTTTCSIAR